MDAGSTLAIDRERFLMLVLAMAAQGCGTPARDPVITPVGVANAGGAPAEAASASETPVIDVPAQEEPRESPSPTVTAAAAAGPSSPLACDGQNDADAVDCSWVAARKLHGPACEGVAGTCELLAGGSIYRPRAARVAAACLERLGSRVCDIYARQKCYEEGIKASCPEPTFEARCDAKIQQCKAANRRVKYTVEECVKVMSSLKGGDRDWALSAMGPSSEGSCKLMFTVF
jgi:hypothetical protein